MCQFLHSVFRQMLFKLNKLQRLTFAAKSKKQGDHIYIAQLTLLSHTASANNSQGHSTKPALSSLQVNRTFTKYFSAENNSITLNK